MYRRLAVRIGCVWLAWQLVAAAASPLIWAYTQDATTACECAHGPHDLCPMHGTAKGKARCSLRSVSGHDSSALLSLLAPIGPERSPSLDRPLASASLVLQTGCPPVDRPSVPDLPPPRV